MYKYERKLKVSDYQADYRDFYGERLSPKTKKSKKHKRSEKKTGSHNFDFYIKKNTRNIGKKFSRIVLTFSFLLTAVVGFSAYINTVNQSQKIEKLKRYDDLIWPIVMQDPPEFDENKPLPMGLMMRAAVWDAAVLCKDDETAFNEDGELALDTKIIQRSFKKLFGKEFNMQNEDVSVGEGLYVFNEKQNKFLIKPISADEAFAPRTLNLKRKGEKTILDVEYYVTVDEDMKPQKKAQYVLNKGDLGEYVAAIRV